MSDSNSSVFSLTNIVAFTILLASVLGLAWWFYDRSQYVYLDDARVASTMISISSRIPGWVVDFPVHEGQRVAKGDTLVSIDARDTRLQLNEIEASLKTMAMEYERKQSEISLTRKQVDSAIATARSNLAAAQSSLRETTITLNQSEKDLRRADSLLVQKMISEETWESTKTAHDKAMQTHDKAQAEVQSARAGLAAAEANKEKLDVLDKELAMIARQEDQTRVQEQRLKATLSDYVILSPISGVIDEKFINQGEYVYPGQRILMLHDPDDVWIKANIKETEVRHVSVGSPVTVSVDAWPGREWKGTVSNVGSAATSQFAMLPAPNPSGNFTKITQRLELKVRLDKEDEKLKPGMMVELKIVAN